MNIMNKIATLWQNATNASKIRTGNVTRRLEWITGIMVCTILGTVAMTFMASIAPKNEMWLYSFAGAVYAIAAMWLYGLRRAVAESQDARKRYIAESKVRFNRACKRLASFALALGITAITLTLMLVVIAFTVKLEIFPSEILELLPALHVLADKVVVHVNNGLELLSSLIS